MKFFEWVTFYIPLLPGAKHSSTGKHSCQICRRSLSHTYGSIHRHVQSIHNIDVTTYYNRYIASSPNMEGTSEPSSKKATKKVPTPTKVNEAKELLSTIAAASPHKRAAAAGNSLEVSKESKKEHIDKKDVKDQKPTTGDKDQGESMSPTTTWKEWATDLCRVSNCNFVRRNRSSFFLHLQKEHNMSIKRYGNFTSKFIYEHFTQTH